MLLTGNESFSHWLMDQWFWKVRYPHTPEFHLLDRMVSAYCYLRVSILIVREGVFLLREEKVSVDRQAVCLYNCQTIWEGV